MTKERKGRRKNVTLRKDMFYGLVAGSLALGAAAAGAADQTAGAAFIDRQGNEIGTAELRQGPNGTLIRIEIDGLPEGWKAIHIHRVGTCEDPN
jgi:superoxide dismutase, Cu-Zn family